MSVSHSQGDGVENGTIEVSILWQLEYIAPSGAISVEASEADDKELAGESPADESKPDAPQKLVVKPPKTPKKL